MAVKLLFNDLPQYLDGDGAPYAGALLFTYAAGSSTKQTVYQDADGNTAHANPIELDANGRVPAAVWGTTGQTYKLVLAPSDDTDPPASPIWTIDDVSPINDTSITLDQWASSGLTATFVSATQFTVTGDQTTALHVGRRLKITDGGGTKYGYITASAYSTLTTVTVSLDSGSLETPISDLNISIQTTDNPSDALLTDAHPVRSGSSDKTKKVRLEIDGLTTATTRVMTIPDADITLGSFADSSDATKKVAFGLSNLTTATTRTLTVPDTNTKLGPSVIAVGRNITASRPTAATVDFNADELLLKDSNGGALLASTVDLTLDITASGANGLDTGTEASSTWYYVWVIAKADGTVAGLLSTSSTAPTMPTGYTFKALAGAVQNDGSSDIINFLQRGAAIYFVGEQSALSGGSQTSETSVSLSSLIPSIAHSVTLHVDGHHTTDQDGAGTVRIRVVSGTNFLSISYEGTGSSVGHNDAVVEIPNVSQNVYYLVAGTNASASITVLGFRLPMSGI